MGTAGPTTGTGTTSSGASSGTSGSGASGTTPVVTTTSGGSEGSGFGTITAPLTGTGSVGWKAPSLTPQQVLAQRKSAFQQAAGAIPLTQENVYLLARFGITRQTATMNPKVVGWIAFGVAAVTLLVASEGAAGQAEDELATKAASVEGTVEVTLTDAQRATLNRLNNIVSNHLTEQDFSGALRDIQGDPVPRPGGGYFDHLDEVKNSLRGLYSVEKSLQGSLTNPNLDPAARAALESGLNKAQLYIGKINELLNGGR